MYLVLKALEKSRILGTMRWLKSVELFMSRHQSIPVSVEEFTSSTSSNHQVIGREKYLPVVQSGPPLIVSGLALSETESAS